MHRMAILAMAGVVPFDLAVPCEVFSRARTADIEQPYRLRVCGETPTVRAGAFDLQLHWGLDELAAAQTIMVPGLGRLDAPISDAVLAALRAAAARGTRIASICTGAFILAAAGLLDGRRATTHWLAAAELAARYPSVQVAPQVLFVDDGQILSSAGAAAGLDLCLHMVRRDYGAHVAANTARLSVMPLMREGGQAQFIQHAPPSARAGFAPLLQWMEQNLHRPTGLAEIAARAGMSERSLSRHFREQSGTTVLQWLLTARIRRAQELLETTDLPIETIATAAGFESAATFRDRFLRIAGTSPRAYRRSFGNARPNAAE